MANIDVSRSSSNGSHALGIPEDLIVELADRVAQLVVDRLPDPEPSTDDGRIAYRQSEAAELLGMSEDHFQRHVLTEIKSIRSGRLRLIPRHELEAWSERGAGRLGDR